MVRILIVGGGSAGWITSHYIKKNLDCHLTIVHKKENEIIGVGESTTPTILKVIEDLKSWQEDSKALIKYGIQFKDWLRLGSEWFHLFEDAFIKEFGDSVEHLRKNHPKINSTSFNNFHGDFLIRCKNNLLETKNNSIPGHGFQVQADKLGLACKNELAGDYLLIEENVKDVHLDQHGIESIQTETRTLYADYFIDCSGFERVLIKNLTSFEPYKDMIANSYITGRLDKHKKRPYTEITALKNGWRWEIDTQDRTNAGYVYCDHLTSHEKAMKESGIEGEKKSFVSGKMKDIAIKNCISNGLAQSFIEPLEATSLMMTCYTVEKFVDVIKRGKRIETLNKVMNRFLNHTKEFVKYHYILSERKDSEWWEYWTEQKNDIQDFFERSLNNKRYCKKNDTLLNHYNIGSMMVGYDCFR
jgi:tryptophan halogenase